jgi:protein-S-isoprenylcysteine O-methyltransferase Ste14
MDHAPFKRGPRVPPGAYFLLAIAAELLLSRYAPLAALIGHPWRLLGIVPIAAGLLLAGVGIAQFARHRTTLHTDRASSALITDGVFALSRNPGYLAILLVLAGEALRLGTLSPWALPLIMAPLLNFYFIPCEEAMLAQTFGAEYVDYEHRVRRWL